MPIPRRIARFNRRYWNPYVLKVAGRLPTFAILTHVGRRSGREYRVPVNAFRTGGGYVIALTYGPQSDWVRNVMQAGTCELETRGLKLRLHGPRIETDRSMSWAPMPVRLVLGRVHAYQYMRLYT